MSKLIIIVATVGFLWMIDWTFHPDPEKLGLGSLGLMVIRLVVLGLTMSPIDIYRFIYTGLGVLIFLLSYLIVDK